jgi:hypothetical protein
MYTTIEARLAMTRIENARGGCLQKLLIHKGFRPGNRTISGPKKDRKKTVGKPMFEKNRAAARARQGFATRNVA